MMLILHLTFKEILDSYFSLKFPLVLHHLDSSLARREKVISEQQITIQVNEEANFLSPHWNQVSADLSGFCDFPKKQYD